MRMLPIAALMVAAALPTQASTGLTATLTRRKDPPNLEWPRNSWPRCRHGGQTKASRPSPAEKKRKRKLANASRRRNRK